MWLIIALAVLLTCGIISLLIKTGKFALSVVFGIIRGILGAIGRLLSKFWFVLAVLVVVYIMFF